MFLISLIFFLLFSAISSTYANSPILVSEKEPYNLSIIKSQLAKYHDSGAYSRDISKTIHKAMYYLKFRINQNHRLNHPQKLAMVLDIDETSLSNYPDLKRLDFGGTNEQMSAAEAAGHDKAIPYTRTLYSYAISHGVTVFFVTGRLEWQRKSTVTNLKNVGYIKWTKLFMKSDQYHQASVAPYKSSIRKKIEKMGYDVVLNIGDQYSDLKGGYADMAVKLPNPFYFIT